MRHETTGRWRLGLALALTTAALWGLLPIALKLLLGAMEPYALTWYRFAVSALLLGAFLLGRTRLPSPVALRGTPGWLMLVAALGLSGNYILYLLGLDLSSPSATQIVIQVAPLFLLFGGLIVFRERFLLPQWFGLAVLVGGMLMFFNDRLIDLFTLNGDYAFGLFLVVLSALSWAAYALAQRQLLKDYASEQIMWLIYLAAIILFLPPAQLGSIAALNGPQLALLAFCCLNTLVAYGCFAEALDHWETSRVSAVLAISPLITLAAIRLLALMEPGLIEPEPVNAIAIAGAVLVVVGSMFCALGQQGRRLRRQIAPEPLE